MQWANVVKCLEQTTPRVCKSVCSKRGWGHSQAKLPATVEGSWVGCSEPPDQTVSRTIRYNEPLGSVWWWRGCQMKDLCALATERDVGKWLEGYTAHYSVCRTENWRCESPRQICPSSSQVTSWSLRYSWSKFEPPFLPPEERSSILFQSHKYSSGFAATFFANQIDANEYLPNNWFLLWESWLIAICSLYLFGIEAIVHMK